MTHIRSTSDRRSPSGAGACIPGPAVYPRRADVQRACHALAVSPDVRASKVEEMRAQLASGSYHPSADDLADAILARADAMRLCR